MESKTRKEQIIEALKSHGPILERRNLIKIINIIPNNFHREITPLIKSGQVKAEKQGQAIYYELVKSVTPIKSFTKAENVIHTPESIQRMKRDIILDWLKDGDLSRQEIQHRLSNSTGKKYPVSNLKRNLYPYLSVGLIRSYKRGREAIYTLGINPITPNQRLPNETDLIIQRTPSLQAFLDMRKTELRKSPKSTRMYAYKIANLYKFLGLGSHEIRPLETIKESDIRDYIRHLVTDPKRRVSDNTQTNILAMLDTYFCFCIEQINPSTLRPYIQINPMDRIKRPSIKQKDQTDLEPEYYQKMLRIVKKEKDLLWETVLQYMLFTGSRVSEIGNLLLERPIDESMRDREKDEFSYPLWETEQIHYFGKGKKLRTNKIDGSIFVSLKRYIREARKPMDPNCKNLFMNKVGQALTEQTIKLKIHTLRQKAGINERITAHSFRRTCARWLNENGMPVESIQIFLGHERIETTMRYLKIKEARKDLEYNKAIGGFKEYIKVD